MKKKSEKNRRSSVPWKAEQLRPEKFVAGARSKSSEQNRNDRRNKQKRQTLGVGKERKTKMKEKEKFFKPKTQGNWKVAGNPRVMLSMPSISTCHVATFHTAPPSHIKFETKPQASQTTQEKKPFTFCSPHDTSLTTTEPGGQLMGVTRTHYLDEVNLVTRSPLTTNKPSPTR